MQNKSNRNLIIGITFLIALVMLYFGINFLRGVNVLKKRNTYVVLFDDVSGLYPSSPIYVNGFQVGLVSNMKIQSNNPILFAVDIHLEGDYKIPKGSFFEFGSDFLGASAVSLVVDQNNSDYHTPGDTLLGHRESDVMSTVGRILPQAESLLGHLDSIAYSLNKLVESPAWMNSLKGIESTISELNASSENLNKVMASLNSNLPTITEDISQITSDLKDMSSKMAVLDFEKTYSTIDSTLNNINAFSSRLIDANNSLGKLTGDVQLHDSLTHTLHSVSKLLEEIRLNPEKYLSVKVRLF